MDEKNEELVDAQIVEEGSRMYGHAEGEPGGEVADEPALVLGDDDPHDAELHEKILSEECAWKGKILDVHRLEVELPNGRRSARDRSPSGCGGRCSADRERQDRTGASVPHRYRPRDGRDSRRQARSRRGPARLRQTRAA